MSFGINAYNDSNEVIISSELKNLHFITKLSTPTSSDGQTTSFGSRWIHTYTVTNCPTVPVPFFNMSANEEVGITAIKTGATTNSWEIEVLTNNVTPVLYIFADATAVSSNDTQGIIVYNADGTAAFDSRARPLAVNDTLITTAPSSPISSFSASGLDCKYCNSNGNSTHSSQYTPNTSVNYATTLPEKPMFFYFSLAQCEREASFTCGEEECDGVDAYGNCVGAKRLYSWTSTYWAFYRATLSYPNTASVNLQYTMYAYDCAWTSSTDGSFTGIGTGGSSDSGGSWPYSNLTLNTADNVVIIGDASRYD